LTIADPNFSFFNLENLVLVTVQKTTEDFETVDWALNLAGHSIDHYLVEIVNTADLESKVVAH
jgi:hypothetical protein